MELDALFTKTPATLDEITARVALALQRHPLCRKVQFNVISRRRAWRGSNWTVKLKSREPDALTEASGIVADIQDAYELSSVLIDQAITIA